MENLKKELTDEVSKDVNAMWNHPDTAEQGMLVRCLLSDIPDAEIEAYGTDEQREEAFDGDFECDEETVAESKDFVDKTFERAYALGVKKLYWDLSGEQYIVIFS